MEMVMMRGERMTYGDDDTDGGCEGEGKEGME